MTSTLDTTTATRPLQGELLYRFDGMFSDIVPIGPVTDGFRLDGHFGGSITAGELAGAQLTGVDYFRIDHDGLGIVRAHEIVSDGERVVAVELHGILRPPVGVAAPRPSDIVQPGFAWPTEPYTIHVSARFETAAADLAHLNHTVVAHTGTVNFTTGELHVDAVVVA
jgi:hypothetical protein